MNYQHVLIITYGRSGSTLLQGLLNSIDGCIVRGENYNACHGLFRAYQAFHKSRELHGKELAPTLPFYGASFFNEERFFMDARALLLNQLLPPATQRATSA